MLIYLIHLKGGGHNYEKALENSEAYCKKLMENISINMIWKKEGRDDY